MPTYHFHIEDGYSYAVDDEGVELPDVGAARREAAVLAGELLCDRPDDLWDEQGWRMTVTDDRGETLFKLGVEAHVAPLAQRLSAAERAQARWGAPGDERAK